MRCRERLRTLSTLSLSQPFTVFSDPFPVISHLSLGSLVRISLIRLVTEGGRNDQPREQRRG